MTITVGSAPDAPDPPMTEGARSPGPQLALLGLLLVLWLLCTIAQLERYLPMRAALGAAAAGCIVLSLAAIAARQRLVQSLDLPRAVLPGLFTIFLASFAVLYPLSQRHVTHQGSDREDALRVELVAVLHHQFPYESRTFRGNRPTPLPGAMLLASPFFFLGRVAWQNLFWAAGFLLMLLHFFHTRTAAAFFWTALVLLAISNLNDLVVGGDYVVNAMYVALAAFAYTRAQQPGVDVWKRCGAMLLLGVAISSRIPYVLVLLPLLAFASQRIGSARATAWMCGVIAAFLIVTVPVFLPDVVHRFAQQMHQNADKLQRLPAHLSALSGALALIIACSSFFLRMSLARVYLLLGLSCMALVAPAMLSTLEAEGGFAHPLTPDMEYFAMPAIFLALWALFMLEAGALRSARIET